MVTTTRLAPPAHLSDAELLAEVPRLAAGSVTLTTVGLLAAHFTTANHRDLLEQARHKSRREVEQLLAARRPQPPVPASVRRLPTPRPAPAAPPSPTEAPAVSPPAPNPAPSLDRALTVLVEALAKQKLGATDRPRVGKAPTPGSRHVPAAVKRAVWVRDGGRCAFVSRQGRRCTERGFLEFHHVHPYAAGGPATADNIELRCRVHNGYEAEQVFGPWGPAVVREPGRVYATTRRAIDPTRTRSGPSWPSAGRPP